MPDSPVPFTRAFCRTALGHVHYIDAGPRQAVPVLLMHQTPRSVDEYADVVPRLARTHRVIAVDTPGYGCSDRPAVQPSIAEYAAAMIGVLDALGCPRAHCVGHHTGGVIAVELAAAHPDRVATVALSGPVYLGPAERTALGAQFVQWHTQTDGSHLAEKWTRYARWTDDVAIVQRAIVDVFAAGETSEFGHVAVAQYRMEERLPVVGCPALLIYGTRDPFGTPEQAGPFRAAFRPFDEVTIEGSVFLPTEAPAAFANAVSAFVSANR